MLRKMTVRGFTSPSAEAGHGSTVNIHSGYGTGGPIERAMTTLDGWVITLTLFVMVVAYDQCQLSSCDIVHTVLTRILVKYIWNKGSIAGPTFKMPFMGPFLDSVRPDIEKYKSKWASGELSCVSVFHKCVTRSSLVFSSRTRPNSILACIGSWSSPLRGTWHVKSSTHLLMSNHASSILHINSFDLPIGFSWMERLMWIIGRV